MKNICFIGTFDKIDLVLYVAKIIKMLGNKVLVVDATELQKSKYIVPAINPTKTYITRYEDIDIALGFNSYEEISRYIESTEEIKMKYDYAIVNIDDQDRFKNFNNDETIKNYFVTSLEMYSIRKGIETIKQIEKPIKIKKVIFSREVRQEDEYYIDYLALGYKINWDGDKINFPYYIEDLEAMMENQKNYRIKIKNLSDQYKVILEYMMSDMLPDVNQSNLKKVIKNFEREV